MLARPSDYWLVCLAGFSQQAGVLIGSAFKSINKDKYKINSIAMSPDLNMGGSYSSNYTFKMIKTTYETAFGKSEEKTEALDWIIPSKFCDHMNRPCFLKNPGPHDCKKSSKQACGRGKPQFILLIYADGNGSSGLLEKFTRFSFIYGIIRRDFLKSTTVVSKNIIDLVSTLEERHGYLRDQISQPPRKIETPLILPVKNFLGKHLTMPELLKTARDLGGNIKKITDDTHRLWRIPKGDKGYRDRRDLDFKPAQTAPHGTAGIQDEKISDYVYALSKYYRLGIPYSEQLHFDVTRRNNGPINFKFECTKRGDWTPKVTKDHVNIYPDDVIGNIS